MGIVGAVILTGAMIAVFYYENTNANGDLDVVGEGSELFTVVWAEETHEAASGAAKADESATVAQGDQQTYSVTIWNYTSVILVSLEWADDEAASPVNAEDEFRVELIDPDGTVVADDQGASGSLSIEYTVPDEAVVAGEPDPKIVSARGNTTTDAETAVKEAAGSAQYEVRVTLVDTNSDVPDPLGDTAGDTSNSFRMFLGYTHWHAWEENNPAVA